MDRLRRGGGGTSSSCWYTEHAQFSNTALFEGRLFVVLSLRRTNTLNSRWELGREMQSKSKSSGYSTDRMLTHVAHR